MDYYNNSQMGFKQMGFSLLIFVYLMNLASSYPIKKTLPSEFMPKNKIEDKGIYGSKIKGGSSHGGAGGKSHGNGNGQSTSPSTYGGTRVIPVYAAGAANNNRQRPSQHGAANCNLNKIKFSTMLMITLVYPLLLSFLLI